MLSKLVIASHRCEICNTQKRLYNYCEERVCSIEKYLPAHNAPTLKITMLAYIHANLCMKTPTRDPRKEKINYKRSVCSIKQLQIPETLKTELVQLYITCDRHFNIKGTKIMDGKRTRRYIITRDVRIRRYLAAICPEWDVNIYDRSFTYTQLMNIFIRESRFDHFILSKKFFLMITENIFINDYCNP